MLAFNSFAISFSASSMSSLLRSFDVRASELVTYVKFIALIERDSATLSLPRKRTWKTRPVDENILRILKANFFLLLYNIVEATIRDGVATLYSAIETEGCSITELSPALRAVWIESEFSRLTPSTANLDSYRRIGRELVKAVVDDIHPNLNVAALTFGGNLDAAGIRKVCDAHSISHKTAPRTKGGEKLLIVRQKRNALAHGIVSFVECGRDYSVAQLSEIQRESVQYLKAILRNIEKFTAKKRYRS